MRHLCKTFWYSHVVREPSHSQLFNALSSGALSVTQIADGKAIIAQSKKAGTIPRSAVPVVSYHLEDQANTHGANVFFVDMSGTRSLEEDVRNLNGIFTAAYETAEINQRFEVTNEFACRAYVNWIARPIAQRLGLPLEDRFKLEIYLAAFYLIDGTEIYKFLKEMHVGRLAERIKMSITTVYSTAEIIRILEDIPAFGVENHGTFHYQMLTDMICQISPMLKSKFDDNMLFSCISGSTGKNFGGSGMYMTCMAVEYRPTFLAMLYTYCTLRGNDNTTFGNILQKETIGNNKLRPDAFVRQMGSIYKELEQKPYQK